MSETEFSGGLQSHFCPDLPWEETEWAVRVDNSIGSEITVNEQQCSVDVNIGQRRGDHQTISWWFEVDAGRYDVPNAEMTLADLKNFRDAVDLAYQTMLASYEIMQTLTKE